MNLEGIVKVFKTKEEEIKVLDNINYQFNNGKLYAITGHSGSGKTTLINILGLIEEPTSGKIFINNKDISNLKDIEISELRSKKIGFIFQDFFLDENLKAYENVIVPMIINSNIKREDRKNKAIDLLKKFGLENRTNHYPK